MIPNVPVSGINLRLVRSATVFAGHLILLILVAALILFTFGCTDTSQKQSGYPDTPEEVWGELEDSEGGRVWDTLTKEQQALVNYPYLDTNCVYWVAGGKSYHSIDWCYTLEKSENIQSGPLTEAIEMGKVDPCSKCVGE